MATGRLGNAALSATQYTSIYSNATTYAVCSVNICNQNATSITIRLAITTTPTAPATADLIEYQTVIPAYGVLERTGLVLANGQAISAYASSTNVSVVVYGIET